MKSYSTFASPTTKTRTRRTIQVIDLYRWTIAAKGKRDIERVSTLEELERILEILALPGARPSKWIIAEALASETNGHSEYVYNRGGSDEWRLVWHVVHNKSTGLQRFQPSRLWRRKG